MTLVLKYIQIDDRARALCITNLLTNNAMLYAMFTNTVDNALN